MKKCVNNEEFIHEVMLNTLLFMYFKNKDAKTNHKSKNKMQYFSGLKIPLPSPTEDDINSGIMGVLVPEGPVKFKILKHASDRWEDCALIFLCCQIISST